jgi:hypothetical protein
LDDDEFGLPQSIQEAIHFFDSAGVNSARGIELDMDAIAYMVCVNVSLFDRFNTPVIPNMYSSSPPSTILICEYHLDSLRAPLHQVE